MFSKRVAALAAISTLTASSAAVAQTSAPNIAAASTARSGAPIEGSNELVGTTAWILAAIALGLIIWGIIELTDDDSSSP